MKNNILILLLLISSFCFSQMSVFDVARKGTLQDIETLYKSNPDAINEVNESGNSPLILACYKGNVEVAKFLIKNINDINYNSPMGTALMAATVKGNVNLVRLLLENKADPNIVDGNGTSTIIYGTMFKNYEIVSLLINANANPHVKDNRNQNAIDYAILANDDKLIQILKSKKS